MTHKSTDFPKSSMYEIVGLGGLSLPGVIHYDNIGLDNISHLNRYYCELTGMHYVWRKTNSPIVGICHYRRYFNLINLGHDKPNVFSASLNQVSTLLENPIQFELINNILENYDMILPPPFFSNSSVAEDYCNSHTAVEWNAFVRNLDELYGKNNHSMRVEQKSYFWNMMICKRELYDHYCSQLFSVIDRVFNEVGKIDELTDARYQPFRYPGYLAERFMIAFINVYKPRIFEADVIVTENQ